MVFRPCRFSRHFSECFRERLVNRRTVGCEEGAITGVTGTTFKTILQFTSVVYYPALDASAVPVVVAELIILVVLIVGLVRDKVVHQVVYKVVAC